MAIKVDEVLAVWRAAERALDALPQEAPERPIIQIQVARLRRCYARLTTEAVPATWKLLESTHETLAETRQVLAEARTRLETTSQLGGTERLMERWLLAEQALNRAADDPARRAELLRFADEARDRYQAALDALDPDLSD
jgi:hypothetical protein